VKEPVFASDQLSHILDRTILAQPSGMTYVRCKESCGLKSVVDFAHLPLVRPKPGSCSVLFNHGLVEEFVEP